MIKFLSKTNKEKLRGTAILRLDFNTEDEWRMKTALPTIRFLLRQRCKVLIVSHKGRPKKRDKKLSLRRDASALGRFLGKKVGFLPHFRFREIKKILDRAPQGSVFVLQNIRFLPGEDRDSAVLGRQLASLGNFYVNDAFAVSHRKSASVSAITRFLPAYGGFQFEREMKVLSSVMKKARPPLVVILGGGKAADKLGLIKYFKNKAKWFLVGGAPANTLLWIRGLDVGKSVVDREHRERLRSLLRYKNLVLPVDWMVKEGKILDIGRGAVDEFSRKIREARTVIWNGPVGLFERKPYHLGSLRVAQAIAGNRRCFSLSGGGETVEFLKKYKLDKGFSFISTGGGAMLDFLAGKKLPGIKALERNYSN